MTIEVASTIPWQDIDRVIDDWRPAQLVVGVPTGGAALARRIQEFADALRARYRMPVATVDEATTSEAARAELRDARRAGLANRRVTKGGVDRLAACLIAEQWLNER